MRERTATARAWSGQQISADRERDRERRRIPSTFPVGGAVTSLFMATVTGGVTLPIDYVVEGCLPVEGFLTALSGYNGYCDGYSAQYGDIILLNDGHSYSGVPLVVGQVVSLIAQFTIDGTACWACKL